MSGAELTVIIGAVLAVLTAIAKGAAWVMNFALAQPLATIKELRATNAELVADRNYWREKAMDCHEEEDPT